MYLPEAFRMDAAETAAALSRGGLATLVTAGPEGPEATPLPLVFDPADGPHGALLGHFARANPHWKTCAGPALALFQGPDAYVSPGWYASKREHGKVVPTWNYQLIEVKGEATVFDGEAEKLALVTRLTELHEAGRAEPWAVSDAPERFTATQLRGIVGVRLEIAAVTGKRKMSQNRSAEDRAGVKAGLEAEAPEAAKLIPEG